MTITIFAKTRKTKDDKQFTIYLSTLTNARTGEQFPVNVKFTQDCREPKKDDCPMNITVSKKFCNLATKSLRNPETGEVKQTHTLWVKEWEASDIPYVDHSMDDIAD